MSIIQINPNFLLNAMNSIDISYHYSIFDVETLLSTQTNFGNEVMNNKLLVQAKQSSSPNYYKNNEKYDPYKNKTSYFDYDDLYDGLPIYNPQEDIWDDPYVLDWINYFKYIINLVLIVIPYAVVVFFCIGWNLWFNIVWN